ncbi:MAG: DMT family transporter [Marichromatium sp.]|nr:DMT family transporter [Marichromatium sp.]
MRPSTRHLSYTRAQLYVLSGTFLIAGAFIASEKLAHVLNPFSLTLMRFVVAVLLLGPFVLFRARLRQETLRVLPRALIMGLFYSLYFMAMFHALKTTTVLNTSTLYTLVPFLTAVLSWVIFREKIGSRKLLVFAIGAVGTLWVIFEADIGRLIQFSLQEGDGIFLAGSFSMCLYAISIKFLHRNDHPLVLVFCTLIGGSLWMGLGLLLLQEPLDWHVLTMEHWGYMLYLSIGTTIVTLYLLQSATIALGPVRVMSYVYLSPAMVACLAYCWEGKTISWIVVPGILLSALATALLQRSLHVKT